MVLLQPVSGIFRFTLTLRGLGGVAVRVSPPTSEAAGSNLALYVGKLVVTCQCLVVYSAVHTGFLHL